MMMTDDFFMQQALKEANKAYDDGEVPVGAVVVMGERIIARGHNQVERLNDPTAHAEIIALTSAFNYLGSKYLPARCCSRLYGCDTSLFSGTFDKKKSSGSSIRQIASFVPPLIVC